MNMLYVLMGISVLVPIYTYVLYPFVLRLFKARSRKALVNYTPTVSVLIVGNNVARCKEKERNVRASDYGNIVEIVSAATQEDVSKAVKCLKGEITVMTDATSVYLADSISKVVAPLAEGSVGCVCGMVRKAPDESGAFRDGANWNYENKIKVLESNIGTLSGANTAIYAFRTALFRKKIKTKVNLDFYIPTAITEMGYDVLFEPLALAYESEVQTEGALFQKHVADGASGYRSMVRFWRLLLPRKGSFVFWSHRVMKWLVPFNMLILLVSCVLLASQHLWALALLACQVFFYLYAIVYYVLFTCQKNELSGSIGKLSGFASYFVVLNVAWFMGLLFPNKYRL